MGFDSAFGRGFGAGVGDVQIARDPGDQAVGYKPVGVHPVVHLVFDAEVVGRAVVGVAGSDQRADPHPWGTSPLRKITPAKRDEVFSNLIGSIPEKSPWRNHGANFRDRDFWDYLRRHHSSPL